MEAENEAVDVESVDDTRPASALLECSSSDGTRLQRKTIREKPNNHRKGIEIPEDLDPESQKLIKEMLEEERRYLRGKKQYQPPPWAPVASVPKKTDHKVSHYQHWTDREKELFSEALAQYGHRWKKVAEFIGTRTPQQVKTFFRYLSRKALKQAQSDQTAIQNLQLSSNQLGSSGEEVKLTTETDSDEGEEIDVLNDSGDEPDTPSEATSFKFQTSASGNTSQMSLRGNLCRDSISQGLGDAGATVQLDEDPLPQPKCGDESVLHATDPDHNLVDRRERMAIQEPEELPIEGNSLRVLPDTTHSLELSEAQFPPTGGSEGLLGSTRQCEDVSTEQNCGARSDTSFREERKENTDRPVVTSEESPSDRLLDRHPPGRKAGESVVQQIKGEFHHRTDDDGTAGMQGKCNRGGQRVVGSLNPELRKVASCSRVADHESEQLGTAGFHENPGCNDQEGSSIIEESFDADSAGSVSASTDDPCECVGIADAPSTINEEEGVLIEDDDMIELSVLSAAERELNGGDLSTRDRAKKYLRIRNSFLNLWETRKPAYVSKSHVRYVFRKFGDTHTIARIHHNLEELGLINVGVANPHRREYPSKKQNLKERKPKQKTTDGGVSPRKSQRQRGNSNWRGLDDEEYTPKPQKKSKRVAMIDYDPFKLIECSQFTEDNPAPFGVSIEADALALMDLHAHLSSAEVIGLLGGQYQAGHNQLCIRVATPCKSLSTGMQCEMDPVSQTIACDSIMSAGLRVVGWYHSHPAFLPNPSVRDIETQAEFQGWFSQDGAPFIGVIVSPYQRIEESSSMISCLMVRRGDAASDQGKYQPYGFNFTTCRDNVDQEKFIQSAEETLEIGQNYHLKIDMDAFYIRDQTYLGKTISSVCSHYAREEDKEFIRSRLTALLVKADKTPKNDLRSPEEDSTDFDNG